jgi:hypothetical protein
MTPVWKYGLIKVGFDEHLKEDENELVELYYEIVNGETHYVAFSRPYLCSVSDIRNALADVEKDGVITWFWDNGVFTWNFKESFWDWKKND